MKWDQLQTAGRVNSVMERFFLSLKMERVWQRDDANPRRSHPCHG
jgi:hypothetical protein